MYGPNACDFEKRERERLKHRKKSGYILTKQSRWKELEST
jgi:hypothetical protein